MKTAAALLAALALTACGSTVQQTAGLSPETLGVEGDGLSVAAGGSVSSGDAPGQQSGTVGGTSGPAAAPQGAASGPTTSGGAAPQAAPGVEPGTPVRGGSGPVQVGFFVTKDLGPATKALGVDGLATGDGRRQAEAAARLLNSTGGIAGRRVVPVVFEFDVTQNGPSQYQAACSLFFDDNDVVGVVSLLLEPVLSACAEQQGAVLVTSGNRAPARSVLDRFPHTAVPSQLPLESVVSTQIGSLVSSGWFRPATPAETVKVGLLYMDTPDFEKVPALTRAALQRAGLTLEIEQAIPSVDDTSNVTAASSAGSNGVLRFRGAGVNRVIAIDKSGQALAYFGIAAQNQSYYPVYGLSSLELPALLRTVLSQRQLEGAKGIGFSPLWDLPLRAQPPSNANVKACLSAMSAAGEDMQGAATRASALTTCDGALTLAAAWRAGDVSARGFLSGLRALGRSHLPVMTPTVDFALGRAPVDSYRTIAFSAGCDCFEYSGAVQRVPR